jgi:hypothetical protein
MARYSALEIVDSVNSCDCCGKAGLKRTVHMQDEQGRDFFFGTACASRHSGKSLASIEREVDDSKRAWKRAADLELASTPESHAYDALLQEAVNAKVTPGKEFMLYTASARIPYMAKRAEVMAKYGLNVF